MLSHQLFITANYIQAIELLWEFYETFETILPENKIKSSDEAIQIIPYFQHVWINTNEGFTEMADHTKARQHITASVSIQVMHHCVAELMWASYYFLQITSGLALLILSFGIKVTDPIRITIQPTNGFFQHRVLNKRLIGRYKSFRQ